jgi:hypothetical protein
MKWEGHEQSRNIEDRRGQGGAGLGGGMGRPRIGGKSVGLGTIAIAFIAAWIFGINPMTVLGLLGGGGAELEAPPAAQSPNGSGAQPRDEMAQFVSTVLRDTEVVWGQVFAGGNAQYREPVLVLFRGATATACGTGESAMGPFYCPGDQKVYLDLGFFETLARRMGAPGDFAQAYVVAHEVGHHVQNLLGITGKVDAMRRRLPEREMNALSVRVELQADCFAGIWAHHSQKSKGWLERGDVEEALNAASQIGDDVLQANAGRHVVPDSFTHGSSAQRMQWFKRGLQTGSVAQCNTFEATR